MRWIVGGGPGGVLPPNLLGYVLRLFEVEVASGGEVTVEEVEQLDEVGGSSPPTPTSDHTIPLPQAPLWQAEHPAPLEATQ